MARTPINPLNYQAKITNPDGTPTKEFIRQWQQQVTTNTLTEEQLIEALEAAFVAVAAAAEAAALANAVAATQVGGDGTDIAPIPAPLSGGNVVLSLTGTAVTPGTYGDATNSAQITVDQKGRITDVVNVPISGGSGGGGSPSWYSGVGNRIPFVNAVATGGSSGAASALLAAVPNNTFFWSSGTGVKTLTFDFFLDPVNMTGIIIEQQTTAAGGTWQMAYSNDDISYTDVGSTFAWGGAIYTTHLFANSAVARYWKLTLVSGSTSSAPYQRQVTFKMV